MYRMGTEKERKDKCLKISWGSYQSENNYGWTQKSGQDQTLIARIVHHQSLNVSAMQWGQAHEKDALNALVKTEWTKHTNMHIFEVGLFAKKRTSLTLGQVLMLLAPVIAVNHLLLNANVHTALKMRGFLTPGIKLSFYGWIVVEHVC